MARLPYDTRDLQGRYIDVRRDGIPVRFQHKVREIDQEMDNIVYNAVDYLQERARDNELRTFQCNMMSDRDWDNSDFEKLISLIADVIDIAMQEGKFRDTRDAVVAVTEDVIQLHVAYLTDRYPDLMDYVRDSRMERDLDRGVQMFEKYLEAVDVYRRNGNRLPRGRDNRNDDRDRDRDRGRANYGSDRGGRRSSRRDEWNRDAMRGGIHGSPQRSITREGRFGNNDQSDRFDDAEGASSSNQNDRRDRRDDRDRSRSNDHEDRFDAANGSNTSRRNADTTSKPARVQSLPGRYEKDPDIVDALARENQTTSQGKTMDHSQTEVRTGDNQPTYLMEAADNLDAWMPTAQHPHPLVFNHLQTLYYEMDPTNELVIPRVIDKDSIVDYYDHRSMAFGNSPKDFSRFENGNVAKRLNELHDALLNPSEEFQVDGSEDQVTYHRKLDFTQLSETFQPLMTYSLKDAMLRLNYRRFALERAQPNGEKFHAVDIAVLGAFVIDSFVATNEEKAAMEELRSISSFTKLAEKMKQLAKKVRPELFLLLDRYLTTNINRMLRQNLSIPELRITSFTSDWLELFSHVTEKFGEAYRDAISTHQESEIRHLLASSTDAEIFVSSQLPSKTGLIGMAPFVVALSTKIIYINEVGYNLDVDMVPEVASRLMPEANPFFHDLAQELLTNDAQNYGRFYIQTSDLRVIEVSRSYISEKAIMLRMIK